MGVLTFPGFWTNIQFKRRHLAEKYQIILIGDNNVCIKVLRGSFKTLMITKHMSQEGFLLNKGIRTKLTSIDNSIAMAT